jgi:ribosomal protein S12
VIGVEPTGPAHPFLNRSGMQAAILYGPSHNVEISSEVLINGGRLMKITGVVFAVFLASTGCRTVINWALHHFV